MTLAASPPRQIQGPQEHEEAVARIVRRTVREENSGRPAADTSATAPHGALPEKRSAMQTDSLERVYRQPGKANNDISAIAMDTSNENDKPRGVTGRDISAASAVSSPVDITRLTDQVLQALDRRIVAQRERMGRV